jgi:ankyrin repeat protein
VFFFFLSQLVLACGFSRPEVVDLLLRRGADVSAQDGDGNNALHLACANGAFGRDMIPLLVKAGTRNNCNKAGKDALFYALRTSGSMAEELLLAVPLLHKPAVRAVSSHDPMGSMSVALEKFGSAQTNQDFSEWVSKKKKKKKL